MSNPSTVVAPSTIHNRRIRTARTTGLFYLALGITGGFGFLLVRPALFAPGAPAETLAHLIQHERLARIGIALEMGLVVTQALAALWFYRLFRPVDDFAAGSIAVFGLVNAVAVLVSSAMLATALQVALHPIGAAGDAQLMYLVSSNLWNSGNLFFGLWLIPMGWCVLRSRWMPLPLGWILIVGGVGYVLTPFVAQIAPDAGLVVGLLPVLATVGELWMIGYLLVHGVNMRAA
jgi:Domain of unknown function (DUF4386)